MADERTEKQKVQEITDKLEEGLKELFESEKYKALIINHVCGSGYIVLIAVLSGVPESQCRCTSECDHDSGCND